MLVLFGVRKYSNYTLVTTDTETQPDARAMGALVRLSHRKWVIPVVAQLGRTGGTRFAVLQTHLAVARTTLERALKAAQTLDLVMGNPGHGHPLRPEYLLTPRGESVAPACDRVVVASDRCEGSELARRKWTLPVLASLHGGAERFGDLLSDLGSCSPRALAQALQHLQTAGLIARALVDGRPPRPTYSVSMTAAELAEAAGALAQAAR